jgi:uncharacterized membrane protein
MTTQDPLEAYLAKLRSALVGMTVADREEIVEEIRTHITDRMSTSGLTIEEALQRLGPVEELAKDYRSGALVKRARTSFSPFAILRATFAWAMTGVHGAAAFVIAVLGYTLGFGMMVLAFLKPLFPEHIGLWIGPSLFTFGIHPSDVPAHEVLGPWFVQVTLLIGSVSILVTTLAMRRLLPRFKYWRTAALRPAAHRTAAVQMI